MVTQKNVQLQDFFTPLPVVRHMSNLCEPLISDPTRKVFEPGCGSGNFLLETLSRRLAKNPQPTTALIAVANLYGVEIDPNFLVAARSRLRECLSVHFANQSLDYRFWPLIDLFLTSNLIQSDLVKHQDRITFIDWRPVSDYNFRAVPAPLITMLEGTNV